MKHARICFDVALDDDADPERVVDEVLGFVLSARGVVVVDGYDWQESEAS